MTMVRSGLIAAAAAAAALVGASTFAQGGGGPGPGASASAPAGAGPRTGMGPGAGRGATRWGSDFTPGWSLMTPQERDEHRTRMRSMQTEQECRIYLQQHHEQMAARAKERGRNPLAQPRRDACSGLKP